VKPPAIPAPAPRVGPIKSPRVHEVLSPPLIQALHLHPTPGLFHPVQDPRTSPLPPALVKLLAYALVPAP
jgi:hypothetical protein